MSSSHKLVDLPIVGPGDHLFAYGDVVGSVALWMLLACLLAFGTITRAIYWTFEKDRCVLHRWLPQWLAESMRLTGVDS